MNDRERAKQLLERLRVRTVERGATPGEAAAAAELADRICRRYGLDKPTGDEPTRCGQELESNLCPGWSCNLALAIATKFRCEAWYSRCRGERAAVIFEGEEHLAAVAQWLFSAVYQDVCRRSHYAALAHDARGPARVAFRRMFAESATWEVVIRLHPPRRPSTDRDLITVPDRKPRRGRKPRPCKPLSPAELRALRAGAKAGQEISLDTNVVGDRRGATLALTAG